MICSACHKDAFNGDGEEYLCCMKDDCNQLYHLLCTGEKNPNKNTWGCPECRCTSKKGGNNSLTPVGVSKRTRDPNVTIRKKITSVGVDVQKSEEGIPLNPDENNKISLELRGLKTEMVTIRDQLSKNTRQNIP
ncbi:Histone-lysine N-methyltransferase NSD3 [Operophtera brumata]|uniref:Histone-lysine N-methyltransferase NSD3 n=1 Tax=Operophtera brumata TaxID=104452 RepID=A0A0L7KGI9_OPEBR|nr:Histone-lysine N-methyltransferase NSD3 [Operophtera brumata]